MKKVILVYGSTTGNTETLAEQVEDGLKSCGLDVTCKNVTDSSSEELQGYDGIILGCSTWGDGELQDDFVEFEKGMAGLNLAGKRAAVFGPGDSTYDKFCNAVDILEQRLKSCGAEIVADSFKVDGEVEPELENIKNWAKELGGTI
ncbi:MAG: flavodoxin [bacterium]